VSPTIEINPGHYLLSIRGRINKGGLSIGHLNVTENRFIQKNHYFRAVQFSNNKQIKTLAMAINVETPQKIKIILSNFTEDPSPFSKWNLISVSLRK